VPPVLLISLAVKTPSIAVATPHLAGTIVWR
jgi:hypothetical protein